MVSRAPLCAVAFTALLLGGCKDREIAAYRAPKDPPPTLPGPVPAATGDTMAASTVPTGSDRFTWTPAAHWVARAPGAMRKGSFTVPGAPGDADLSITAFPGDTGGLLANLNRWRSQLALPPLAEGQLDGAVEHVDANGLHFELVDFAGTAKGAPARIVGAILTQPGETWFFKLMGPDALVAGEKAAFRDFLGTVKPRQP